ncbi:hypothetical protein V6N11_046032 [Hibiscus sabdariffa]|uniref:HAT C-terminal dimerisation domain-containing protein n=2 Tax=Hibiscus sabdariffa TaxID=183260 RepID=A0ABR2Q3B3_9ROSI
MQESLNGVLGKRDKKQKRIPKLLACGSSSSPHVEKENSISHDDIQHGIKPISILDTFEADSDLALNGKGEVGKGSKGRKRGRDLSSIAKSDSCAKNNLALVPKRVENTVNMAIGRFLYDIGVDLDAVNSVCFQLMIDAIVSGGSGTVPPSYEDLRGWILKNVIEEDFGSLEWINETIGHAKSLTRFVYNRSVVLNMMRRFTSGNDIVEPALTRFATNFATLKRMADLKLNLQAMVNSQDWLECHHAKKPGGLAMSDIVSNRSFWNSCVLIARITYPLLRVLEIVGSKKKSTMGYVYAGIYRAKETIKKELVKKDDYMVYWNIIDNRWEQQRHLPLYAAGFFLNPKFFYSTEGNIHNSILSSMFDSIERLVPDANTQDQIVREINLYKNASGDLGRPMAVRARDNLLPGEWWSIYGGGCPNLQNLAIRILGQTCSSIGCKPNKISMEEMHDTRNFLERQGLADLVIVQYNLYLRQMVLRNREKYSLDPLSFNSKDVLEDWIADNEIYPEDYGSSDWMSLDPPVANRTPLAPSGDETEDFLGTGFTDLDIFNGLKGVKEEI